MTSLLPFIHGLVLALFCISSIAQTLPSTVSDRLERSDRSELSMESYLSSVVYITNIEKTAPNAPSDSLSYGSGFFFDTNGLIITNAHVIANSKRLSVRLYNNPQTYPVKIVAQDDRSDIAILKPDLPPGVIFRPIPFEASLTPPLRLLESVWTIGHPYDFDFSFADFKVASLRRFVSDDNAYLPFIQLQGNAHPGNSGGPLFNTKGQIVGMLTQSYSTSGGHALGISFAIPLRDLQSTANILLERKTFIHGRMGLSVQPLTPDFQQYFKTPPLLSGILVSYVDNRLCPSNQFLQPGDILLSFNRIPLQSPSDFVYAVASSPASSSVQVEFFRNQRKQTASFKVCSELQKPPALKFTGPLLQPEIASLKDFSIEVQPLLSSSLTSIRPPYTYALSVLTPPPKQQSVRPGDLILSVDQQPFSSLTEFEFLLRNKEPHLLLIQSESQAPFLYLLNP